MSDFIAHLRRASRKVREWPKWKRDILGGMDREDRLLSIMRRLYESMEETRYPHPDAPGHSHIVPGRWDEDGSECERCKAWADLKAVLAVNKKGGGG